MRFLWIGISAFLLTGCAQHPGRESPAQKKNQDDQKLTALQEEQLQMVREMKSKLEDLKEKIKSLKGRADKAGGEVKKSFDKELVRLQQIQEKAAKKVDEFRKSAASAWQDLKTGTRAAVDELERAVQEASKKFK